MVAISKDDFIWVESCNPSCQQVENIPIGARVLNTHLSKEILILDDEKNERKLSIEKKIRIMHPTSIQGMEDFTQLYDLHEAAILRNVHIRFCEKIFYTFCGSKILVFVNSFKNCPVFFNNNNEKFNKNKKQIIVPYILTIANNAYLNIVQNNVYLPNSEKLNQCIVLNGQTNSGKSQNAKLLLQYYLNYYSDLNLDVLNVKNQLNEVFCVLEAFANAKTIHNNNSSRHGKFIDLQFNSKTGIIESAKIESYFFENSRVVSYCPNEHNFHIFYLLLNGLNSNEKYELELNQISDYHYLTQNEKQNVEDFYDKNLFLLQEVKTALKVLLFKDAKIFSIFKVLAAILHIGNIQYNIKTENHNEYVEICDTVNIKKVAKLLQVDVKDLINALSRNTIILKNETVSVKINPLKALDIRDLLAKKLYGKLFEHILQKINEAILRPAISTFCDKKKKEDYIKQKNLCYSIGIIELFGIENKKNNCFEQLCFNYASELIHQFYICHVFKAEQAEYESQNVQWKYVDYSFLDNFAVLDVLAIQPLSILSIINDESIFPQATDETLLTKLNVNHGHNKQIYIKAKSDLNKIFGINHYSEPVFYDVKNFLEKNRDSFNQNLISIIESSKFRLLHRLFEYELQGTNNNQEQIENKKISSFRQTVEIRLQNSLENLIKNIENRELFFVNCIASNNLNKQMYFDRYFVNKQLKNFGIFEATVLNKSGYSARIDYNTFINCYRVFLPPTISINQIELHQIARHICAIVFGREIDCQFGKTKIFLKSEDEAYLQNELLKFLNHHAQVLQKTIRGHIKRKNFLKIRSAAIILQKNWKTYLQKKNFKKTLKGISRLQAAFRSYQLVLRYNYLQTIIIQFQSFCRGAIIRNIFRENSRTECRNAIIERVKKDDIVYFEKEEDLIERFSINLNNHYVFKKNDDENNDFTEYSNYLFENFAATYFEHQISAYFTNKILLSPLLKHQSYTEKMASLSIWVALLKIMNLLPIIIIQKNEKTSKLLVENIHVILTQNCTKKMYANFKTFLLNLFSNAKNSNEHNLTSDLINETYKKNLNNNDYNFYIEFFMYNNSIWDLMQFIVAHGILNTNLRDEIFCQICKQLNYKNLSKLAIERVWILLALCVGCFTPSQKFVNYFLCFLQKNRPDNALYYNKFVESKLKRTFLNGKRKQLPSIIEYEACKKMENLQISVYLMDNSSYTIDVDSSSTAGEICLELFNKIGIELPKDNNEYYNEIGFSLYIAFSDKVFSLGCNQDLVFDAISQSEQLSDVVIKNNDQNKIWRLFFKKEFFVPWFTALDDAILTNLIYQQIVLGVRYGEYKCEKEEDLAFICLHRYFIEHKTLNNINIELLEKNLINYLPNNEFNEEDTALSTEKWLQLILNLFRKKFSETKDLKELNLKNQVVLFAMHKWSLMFSRFCEAFKMSPHLNTEVLLAVNSTGVCVLNQQDEKIQEFTFPEIACVSCKISKESSVNTLIIEHINSDEFVFQAPNAEDMCQLIKYFIKGLQNKSKYLIATQVFTSKKTKAEENEEFDCVVGDLLILKNNNTDKENLNCVSYDVENTRTGLHGIIPTNCVFIIPTLTNPNIDLLNLLKNRFLKSIYLKKAEKNFSNSVVSYNYHHLLPFSMLQEPHTLKNFAAKNFYTPIKNLSSLALNSENYCVNELNDSKSKALILNNNDEGKSKAAKNNCLELISSKTMAFSLCPQNELWSWFFQPIQRPLLKKITPSMVEPSVNAVLSFKYIMKYMGDLPTMQPKYFLEFTDIIFRAPLKYQILRDEIYCQLIKQLTKNPNPLSEEKGWELMWLCLGLFPPSIGFEKELRLFLETRYFHIAADCVFRLQRVFKLDKARKFPPHQVEVEAIQHKTTQIFHKVFLPNGSEEIIEIDSFTTAKDFCERIATRLHLKSKNGYSIFIKIREKGFCLKQ